MICPLKKELTAVIHTLMRISHQDIGYKTLLFIFPQEWRIFPHCPHNPHRICREGAHTERALYVIDYLPSLSLCGLHYALALSTLIIMYLSLSSFPHSTAFHSPFPLSISMPNQCPLISSTLSIPHAHATCDAHFISLRERADSSVHAEMNTSVNCRCTQLDILSIIFHKFHFKIFWQDLIYKEFA